MKAQNQAQENKLEKFKSNIIKEMICEFDTFYDPVDCPEDIVVFDSKSRFFLVLSDNLAMFARKFNFTGRPPDDYVLPKRDISIPLVRAVYVHPSFRGNGVQENIFSIIIGFAEKHREPFFAHAKPFDVPNPQLNEDARAAFSGYYSMGIIENRAKPGERDKQRERLKQYGLVPCSPTNGSKDASDYDLAYVPRSASSDVHDLILGKPIC